MRINELLQSALDSNASDLFVTGGKQPRQRQFGKVVPTDEDFVELVDVITFTYNKQKVGTVKAIYDLSEVPPQLKRLAGSVVRNSTEIEVAHLKGIRSKIGLLKDKPLEQIKPKRKWWPLSNMWS